MDLWLDGYRPGVPDRKVSMYHKGALVALLLDLTIRQLSGHARSLDDVMRRLYEEFGKTGIGYTEADYVRIVNEVAGRNMQAYFKEFIDGTAPVEEPLDSALRTVGCQLLMRENPRRRREATVSGGVKTQAHRGDAIRRARPPPRPDRGRRNGGRQRAQGGQEPARPAQRRRDRSMS